MKSLGIGRSGPKVNEERGENRKELWITAACLGVTLVAIAGFWVDVGDILVGGVVFEDPLALAEQMAFVAIIVGLIYGNLVYQLCRFGAMTRRSCHTPPDAAELERVFALPSPPKLAVLVPSYKEEVDVVYQTLLSAALLHYPNKRVVLLIDDPPAPGDRADWHALKAARDLPGRISGELAEARTRFTSELRGFDSRLTAGELDAHAELRHLAALCEHAAAHYETLAAKQRGRGNVDRFFRERNILAPASEERERGRRFLGMAGDDGMDGLAPEEFRREYARLASLFAAEVASFERKLYANLSHAPNKAMNLNSYIGLMGKRWERRSRLDGGLELVATRPTPSSIDVPDADYIITLDADSLLLADYALKLIDVMERPENARVGIIQTPYSAYPQAPSPIEWAAGATTDTAYVAHQGATAYGATYWVGANALIRRRSLDDIATTEEEDGKPVVKYIQDRTVIEDTESTIDMLLKGWTLHNYPERLAYSATPPDYGAFLVQRRRWANGGLIILPKLLRLARRETVGLVSFIRFLIQANYLVCHAVISVGVLALILYPFESGMRSYWLPLTAIIYLFLYSRDLRQIGYRWRDLPRVYALNLLLIPINLGGVAKSISQMVTGRRTPFIRTPKVSSRTAAPPTYIAATLLIAAYCLVGSVADGLAGRWAHAAFASINALAFVYAVARYMGLRACAEDLLAWRGLATVQAVFAPKLRRVTRIADGNAGAELPPAGR